MARYRKMSTQASRGRRSAQAITLDEDALFEYLSDHWPEGDRPIRKGLGGGLQAVFTPAGDIQIKLKFRLHGKERFLHLGELGNHLTEDILARYAQAKQMLKACRDPRGVVGAEDAVLERMFADMERKIAAMKRYVG